MGDISDRPKKRKSQSPHTDRNQAKIRDNGRPKASDGKKPITPANNSAVDVSTSGEDLGGNPNVITRKRKSILQPSGGKFSKKAAARRRNLAATQDPDDSQQDEEDGVNSHEAAEVSPIITIRNAKDLALLNNPPTNRSPNGTPSPNFLPRKYLELKVVEYPLPSTDPQGPGDLWTCTFEGCFHRVHEASSSAGKKRIKDHFKTHATQAQEKIDLALDESRPYLPVE